MNLLVQFDQFDQFRQAREFLPSDVDTQVLSAVRELDEREELEPLVRTILADSSSTPHGPAELVDILTHKLTLFAQSGLAAFIIKGKSFPTVRPRDVSHQIYRLEKIEGLKFAVFGASGTTLDEAKEQFCSTCERLGCHYAILDALDFGRLLVAYGFLCPRDGNRVVAGRCTCGYSPKFRVPNIFQRDALSAIQRARKNGARAGLVVLPPGSGKTRIGAEAAKESNAKSVLFVAHTNEMLDVAQSEFEAVYGYSSVTRHMNRKSLYNPTLVNIASIQLIRRNLDLFPEGLVDYLIVDEFHHAAAMSYRNLINQLSPAFLLGLTATPFRSDRQDILELCDNSLLINFELRAGIESGILCPYHYYGCFDDIDYSRIRMLSNGRYDIRDLERALVIPERDRAVVSKWREFADGKPTLAFCCSQKHAHRVAQGFQIQGIAAEVYIASTPRSERQALVEQLVRGELKVLCVVDVLNEGADFPFIECLLFLRPTESMLIFQQQLGRGLRRFVGKTHCVVIDFIGGFRNAYKIPDYHGLLPYSESEDFTSFTAKKSRKDLLNLPLGCEVHFDDQVIDLFAQQILDPRYATRHNIGRILIYQYEKLACKLGRKPRKSDVDRNLILHSDIFARAFGSWRRFEDIATRLN